MKISLVIALTLGMALTAPQPYTAAQYAAGAVPGLAPLALGGGQAIVELTVNASGSVDNVRTVRSTPPFTDLVVSSVRSWSFTPASDDPIGADGKPQGPRNVASKVIVAAVYRAPALQGPTQGERPVNVAAASADVAFPSTIREPVYPPLAQFGGVVLIEAHLNASGTVTQTRVISSSPAFDQAALEAARQWRFRPARIGGNTDTYAYLIFGFQQPITITKR